MQSPEIKSKAVFTVQELVQALESLGWDVRYVSPLIDKESLSSHSFMAFEPGYDRKTRTGYSIYTNLDKDEIILDYEYDGEIIETRPASVAAFLIWATFYAYTTLRWKTKQFLKKATTFKELKKVALQFGDKYPPGILPE